MLRIFSRRDYYTKKKLVFFYLKKYLFFYFFFCLYFVFVIYLNKKNFCIIFFSTKLKKLKRTYCCALVSIKAFYSFFLLLLYAKKNQKEIFLVKWIFSPKLIFCLATWLFTFRQGNFRVHSGATYDSVGVSHALHYSSHTLSHRGTQLLQQEKKNYPLRQHNFSFHWIFIKQQLGDRAASKNSCRQQRQKEMLPHNE